MDGPGSKGASVKRRCLLLSAIAPLAARAGAQLEEPLADAVRSALSAAIAQGAPPRPTFTRIEERLAYLRWLGEMSERLKRRKKEAQTRIEFLETVWYESKRAGLETSLVLGLIQVESGFRKYAISSAGARPTFSALFKRSASFMDIRKVPKRASMAAFLELNS